MLLYGGLGQRIVSAVVVAIGAFGWQLYRESDASQFAITTLHDQINAKAAWSRLWEVLWPPSMKSAAFLCVLIFNFMHLVRTTFFHKEETPESRRVRQVKRRLLLLQMTQALRWNEDDKSEEKEREDCDKEKKDESNTKKKRPPPVQDLFEMVYDDVEERHVTEYDIPGDAEPYISTLAFFKERLAADFEEYVLFTHLARREAKGENIANADASLDNDDLKRIPEFLDGTKLTDLLNLYSKKIKKAFGKNVLDKKLLRAAETCKRELAKEQRKGMAILLPALRPVLPMYAFAVCLMIFDASNGTVVFHSMKILLDKVGTGEVTLEELGYMTLQTYVKFIFCVFAHLSSWAFTHKVTADFRLKVRNQIMANMVRQDMKFFDIYPSGILQERLNNDAEQLSSRMFHLPIRLVDSFCRLISCIVVLYNMEPRLFYVVAAPVPIIAISSHYIIRYMRTLGQRQRKIGEHVAANTMEVLKEIRTVREFAMESEEADKFAASSAYRAEIEQYASAMHHIILISPLCCLFEGMRFFSTYLGGCFVAGGQLTPGMAVMAAGLAGDMTHIMRNFFDIMPEIVNTLQPLGRVCDMLSVRPRIEPCPGSESKLKPDRIRGEIEFRNVDFTFPSEPLKQVLFDLSWSIKPCEKVGFVGGTGCGKSTSLYLIERWYDQQSGSILLDGRNISDYDVYHLRRRMSVVAQTTCLFSTTIRENIVYGLPQEVRESITDADIESVLRQANAWDFVNDFPRKLETYAGERGVKLSGGQKQRLAIARAIIRKPSIVLLDEATSALDSKAEVVVQEALDKMVEEKEDGCCIIIAHRLSTLRMCNRIIVMDKGSVKESGTHDELMAIDIEKDSANNMIHGWYRDLYETQHGKGDHSKDVGKLNEELNTLKVELAKLANYNSQLLGETIKRFKLGNARRAHMIPLTPLTNTNFIQATTKVRDFTINDENEPPPVLDLTRARTTLDW
jgi:ABC-type multidrug transport system fused ATPase/permease subunit